MSTNQSLQHPTTTSSATTHINNINYNNNNTNILPSTTALHQQLPHQSSLAATATQALLATTASQSQPQPTGTGTGTATNVISISNGSNSIIGAGSGIVSTSGALINDPRNDPYYEPRSVRIRVRYIGIPPTTAPTNTTNAAPIANATTTATTAPTTPPVSTTNVAVSVFECHPGIQPNLHLLKDSADGLCE
jgi:hypothetical protein